MTNNWTLEKKKKLASENVTFNLSTVSCKQYGIMVKYNYYLFDVAVFIPVSKYVFCILIV